MAAPTPLVVFKGHGTENDFVVLPDLDGRVELSAELTRRLCDRHAGLGADGVLRVVRTNRAEEVRHLAADAPYFMDYRNADGSTAEMCGNGIRVFLRYLQRVGLVDTDAAVATRGGIMLVHGDSDGLVTVRLGPPRILADRPVVTAAPGFSASALATVLMPNPHVVVPVATADGLAALELTHAPTVAPNRPDGQNVEFVHRLGPRHLRLRVHERGVGETRSCGTGIGAAAVAFAAGDGAGADGTTWRVEVPGGACEVIWGRDGVVSLRGPAVIVAEISLDAEWLAGSPVATPA